MGYVHSTRRDCRLDGVAFSFSECMTGTINICGMAALRGHRPSQSEGKTIHLAVRIRTADLGRFLRDPRHRAELAGTVSIPRLGGTFEIREGRVELFSFNPQTGARQSVYSFHFRTNDDHVFFFRGCKNIHHESWRFDTLKDMTHLSAIVYQGMDENAPEYGTGELRFRLTDFPALIASMKCEGAFSYRRNFAARVAFLSVAWGALRNEYLKAVRIFYESQYENLVLTGKLENLHADVGRQFFIVSGFHDKNFPWGDGELFSDVLLAIRDCGGGYRRYCITDRILPGLEIDVAAGTYRYRGPIFALNEGISSSWSRMKSKTGGLTQLFAEIEVDFETHGCDVVSFPFPGLPPLLRRVCSRLIEWIWRTFPGTNPPGIHIRSQAVTVRSGSIRILRGSDGANMEDISINASDSGGECEHGTFRNVKRPRLRYRYRCTVDPIRQSTCVQIAAGTFRIDRPGGGHLDGAVARIGSAEIRHEGKTGLNVIHIKPRQLESGSSQQNAPVLELNNDHYPTAVFQRRIVEVEESGERHLALEEEVPHFCPPQTEPRA